MSDVFKICEEIMKELHLDIIPLELTSDDNNNMYYDFKSKKIYINIEQLKLSCLAYPISFDSYVKIIFLHELGHATDKELEKINHNINICFNKIKEDPFREVINEYLLEISRNKLKSEINAWNYVEKFIEPKLKNVFYRIRKNSLEENKHNAKLERKIIRKKIEICKTELNLEKLREKASKM